MRFSSVLASSLICVSAISADFETSKDNVMVLDKVTVSSKIEKIS
ncbi:hypothetical protein [Campylobacter hyointestinalis]|nr:hypothetical protein [Campylobacter hyointestinalis]